MSRCTCVKDSEITCIIHTHDYEKVRVLAATIAECQAALATLYKCFHEREPTPAHEVKAAWVLLERIDAQLQQGGIKNERSRDER